MAPRTTSYLKQRKLGWYVQVHVPPKLQAEVGKRVIVRSLGTRDKGEADRRKHGVIADILAGFGQGTAAPGHDSLTPTDLLKLAVTARQAIESGEENPANAAAAFDGEMEQFLSEKARVLGTDAEGHPNLPPADVATLRRAHKALAGSLTRTLGHQWPAYLKEQEARLTAQTIGDKRRRLEAFAEWFGGDRDCVEVSRRVAGKYVAEVVLKRTQGDAGETLSPVTMKKEVSDLRAFFDWLLVRGVVESNPFDRMASTVKTSTRGKPSTRRPWAKGELSTVLRGISPDDPLWSLTVIAAYTGMRREEVAELKTSAVDRGVLKVEEGKTAAAVRRVPIHPILAPLIRRLVKTSTDGYLISGLLRGGPDSKRAWYLGKRFGHVIRQLGIADPGLDFHALRGTVITQLEGAGVPVSTIQLIVGHKRQGMTLGVYSAGVGDTTKRQALGHVSYGKVLDGYIAATGAMVTVAPSAKARGKVAPDAE